MNANGKVGLLIAAIVSFTALPALAEKKDAPRAASGQEQGGGEERKQKFEELKGKLLQRMKEHQACVEAAKDFDDLRNCKPERGGHMGGDGMSGGMHGGMMGGGMKDGMSGGPDNGSNGGPDRSGD